MPRILMVSPYPPARDGIATYAVQEVAALRRSGAHVEVLSPGPSAAHHHLDLVGPRGALALAKRGGGFDRMIVQFHPDLFFPVPASPRARIEVGSALAVAFGRTKTTVVVHEVDYRWGQGRSPAALAVRAMWRAVDQVLVHTKDEGDLFADAFGVPPERITVVDHGRYFRPLTRVDQPTARRSLGVDPDAFVFLSIGFVQPHKGFDRAIRAFAGMAERGARLYVVGSVRVTEPDYVAYAADLEEMAARTPGVQVRLGYVGDERFDRWIVASDALVLPYRQIWSSGVLERARIYRRRVIATDVGNLRAQAADDPRLTVTADSVTAVAAAMRELAFGDAAAVAPRDPWPVQGDRLSPTVQAEVERRAAERRGGGRLERRPATGSARAGSAGGTLRRLPAMAAPVPTSARPGAGLVKKMVRRLTAWEVDPLVAQVNALQRATIRAVEDASAARDADDPAHPSTERHSST